MIYEIIDIYQGSLKHLHVYIWENIHKLVQCYWRYACVTDLLQINVFGRMLACSALNYNFYKRRGQNAEVSDLDIVFWPLTDVEMNKKQIFSLLYSFLL